MALLASSAILEARGFGVAPPAPTVGPPPLGARQEAFMETCAWYPLTSSGSDWDAIMCEEPCTTSDGKFGCSFIPQTCQDSTDPLCAASATYDPAVTCCESDYPFCVTGFLTSGVDTLTAFRCGRGELSGVASLYLSPEITSAFTSTTTTTTEEESKPKTITKVVAETSQTETPDDGGSPPIGAIVGGTIGGVALILLVAFAIWFIRFQRGRSADSAAKSTPSMEPYRQPEYAGNQPSYAVSPTQGHQSGYYAPSTQSYEPQGYAGAPVGYASTAPGCPPPGQSMMTQMDPVVELPGYSGYSVPQELSSHGR
ncbi:uncharacterized protein J7T54_001117 [Emericellopsis cladophorae]|uniref:Uncharacterized protein n=1 Tax=Emericellopsis cladophorae TaxID=2686198 RepID=A0A9P9Y0P9_9HYPO|nr:uncharacterized protein J7T54_001117 [Emericellopsis cladophorae]KAI6780809.1 hypothetical protein J7T54_001117 [Emericellopsis cladophorae]